jgi:biopolymer transport protein ExbB
MTRRFTLSIALLLVALPAMAAAADDGGFQQAVAWFEKGGKTMWLLGTASIAGLAFCIERLVRVRRGRIAPHDLVTTFQKACVAGDAASIRTLAAQRPCTLSRAMEAMVERQGEDGDRLAGAAMDAASMELRPLLRSSKPLIVVASLAPLLGLMGTVLGMIGAFEQFAMLGQSGEPAIFATHISEALVTTASGLLIAVPTMVAYHFFKSRVLKFGEEIEVAVNRCAASLAAARSTAARA